MRSKMEPTTPQNSSPTPYTSQETWRMECEAREWIRIFNDIKATKGLEAASGWWGQTIRDIEKKRGPKAAQELRNAMNRLRK
jgi:hypothetical protein